MKSLSDIIHEKGLSRKQAAIFRLYLDGKTSAQICRVVDLSEKTINSYLSEVVGRLGADKKESLKSLYGSLREAEGIDEDLDALYDKIDRANSLFGQSDRPSLRKRKARALRLLPRGAMNG